MFRKKDERVQSDSKLHAVFSKLTGVFPRAADLNNATTHKMSSDIIESVLTDVPIPQPQHLDCDSQCTSDDNCEVAINALSKRLETELRQAKSTSLGCCEVLLPCGLLQRISKDIIAMAESEPCGLRGCTLYLNFEGLEECRRLSIIKCDPTTASTFELYLTLKQAPSGWNSFLPQFLRNLTRGGTIVISPAYILSKNKLYRSYIE
ncbi:hypothetical protein PPYR_13643 [Photinus pyralis]|uniref:Protein charybde n=1 Tax=Photinus pyralis TaxID=7054 RepID=A0A1Y1LPS5_PHOPY|nr:protein charybde-like [Photinus pyralis]KAB0794023.1 hypothetical protein PPYR_13643 [Photinus pyralis]